MNGKGRWAKERTTGVTIEPVPVVVRSKANAKLPLVLFAALSHSEDAHEDDESSLPETVFRFSQR